MVERWREGFDPGSGCMYEDHDGEWVRIEDYKAVVDKLDKITKIIRSRPAEPDVYECADMIELIKDEL